MAMAGTARSLGRIESEQELLAGTKGAKIEVRLSDIRKKGLVSALRERVVRW